MAKRREDFPIDPLLVDEFEKVNEPLWNTVPSKEGAIFLNLSMVRLQVDWFVPKLLYAKGLQEKTGWPVYVFTWMENELLDRMVESFGFTHVSFDRICRKTPGAFIKSFFKTLGIFMKCKSGEDLKKVKIYDLHVGMSIYEDILRTSTLSTIRKVRTKLCMKKILHILWTFYALVSFGRKHRPSFVICDDIAYHENLLLQLWHYQGAEIYHAASGTEEKILFEEDGTIMRRSMEAGIRYQKDIQNIKEDTFAWVDSYLAKRYAGTNGRDIDRQAFAGKRVLSRQEAVEEFGLDPSKKNIVIMAHTFSDGVFNYGETPFRDYYDFTEQTLKMVAEIPDANWILKPHPTRSSYNESEDSIELMFERLKKPHMFFMSDDVSAESIRNVADAIITIGGSAGGEFACEGVPSVIAGKPYYAGFGYTMEPKTKEEYKECLHKICRAERLSAEQIETARKVFYLHESDDYTKRMFRDEFGTEVYRRSTSKSSEFALRYFASNEGTKDYNDDNFRYLIDYFKNHDMRQVAYYTQGAKRGQA